MDGKLAYQKIKVLAMEAGLTMPALAARIGYRYSYAYRVWTGQVSSGPVWDATARILGKRVLLLRK